jgi:Ca2+-binding RTX toxin-like protein
MSTTIDQPFATFPIDNLDGDAVQTVVQQPVSIDKDGDATITATEPLISLAVDNSLAGEASDELGIETGRGHITLSGALEAGVQIFCDGTLIGSVSTLDATRMIVDFEPDVTTAQVEELIHSLIYTNSSDASAIFERTISITLLSENDTYFADTTIRVAPASVVFLEEGVETRTGTSGDDTFALSASALDEGDSLDGDSGNDTLQLVGIGGDFDFRMLAELKNIEAIVGRTGVDTIVLTAQQVSGITAFDGGTGPDPDAEDDSLIITGGSVDLSDKTLTNIEVIVLHSAAGSVVTFDDKDLALKTSAYQKDVKLVLIGDSFTDEEREQLHAQGFKIVEDSTGTDIDEAPQVSGLNGDRHYVVPQTPTFLDYGRNAVLSDDSAFIASLKVNVVNGSDALDRLGIDTTGKVGRDSSSAIFVSGTQIGFISSETASHIEISLNFRATPALVQELLRSLTYTSVGPTVATREISITLEDSLGNTTQSTVTVLPDEKPTQVNLTGSSVAELAASGELVGTLSAADANPDDSVAFKLLDDAGGRFKLDASGTKMVVADGVKIDFEQAKTHTVTVRATDRAGHFTDKVFSISVRDISPEIALGSVGNDKIVAGAGRDKLSGGFGDDTLNGGLGNDILNGGKNKDTFVFDSKLGKTDAANKKSNLDKIEDFSFKDDTIYLAKSVFTTIAKKGGLAKGAFYAGPAAHDASDRIVYNKKTGALLYDRDGSGSKDAIQFATLPKDLNKLSASDFFVF